MPTITLQDSQTQTDFVETVSVGTKPKTPPEPKSIAAQAVAEQAEKFTQAIIELPVAETSIIGT